MSAQQHTKFARIRLKILSNSQPTKIAKGVYFFVKVAKLCPIWSVTLVGGIIRLDSKTQQRPFLLHEAQAWPYLPNLTSLSVNLLFVTNSQPHLLPATSYARVHRSVRSEKYISLPQHSSFAILETLGKHYIAFHLSI